ncbi:expressed unknown protein [Seminavis robusta]|uniref:Uncharacterized protein n=1 Tax=Seminavis robusta TaxID=568900 RepID=A0A9N8HLK3_9STRA|nr:expressed unknown protein [Seminavis robusta]|eukprot:Sro828_g207940.1 n/a (605) ;mRNA; f:6551-8596
MSTRSFTEAVPLSLSSMAHMSHELEDGVVDGLRQVLQHTLLSCVNYVRMVHRTHEWTLHDLGTSMHSFTPCKGEQPPKDLPWSLSRLGFKHQYARHAFIYFKPLWKKQNGQMESTAEEEQALLSSGWEDKPYVVGRLSLLYASQELLTKEELDGTESDDVPPLVLYKVLVEYRSLPATGSQQAVQAEELSMLSFGGSVDDDVKIGALASLYDSTAKYVLEIYSVRGKKYKFDLMDSTLSDGTVPSLNSKSDGDPFVKSLCVTVTDHEISTPTEEAKEKDAKEATKEAKETTKEEEKNKTKYAITRIHLTLDGNLRKGKNSFENLPKFDAVVHKINQTFLFLHTPTPLMATGKPSGQTLLLDPDQAGKLYINGRYLTTWGKDPKLGSHFPALFGMDLHSVSFWHGRVMDFESLKSLYDPVGISAKALATTFASEFGKKAYPCLTHEVDWVKDRLPGRKPVVVPQRVVNVLRRGGYFSVKMTSSELWFAESRPPKEGTETKVVEAAIKKLEEAGCDDVKAAHIVFSPGNDIDDVVKNKAVCRYNETLHQFHFHEKFLASDMSEMANGETKDDGDDIEARAFVMGMFVSQQHPDGTMAVRYLLRNKN